MSNDNTIDCSNIGKFKDELTAILCEGPRRLLQVAVEAELGEFLKQHEDRRTGQNLRLVAPSGHHPERLIQTGTGPVPVRIPKVRSSDGKPVTFRSSVVPPHVRKSRTLEAPALLQEREEVAPMSIQTIQNPVKRILRNHRVQAQSAY